MTVIYCDGSYCSRCNVTGVGIVSDSINSYIEIPNLPTRTHEVEAIIRSIELGLMKGIDNFTVVNDDINLVRCINEMLDDKNKKYSKILKMNRVPYLMKLLKENNIKLKTPRTREDLLMIKKSHNLSRGYILKENYRTRRNSNIKKTEFNYKKPLELIIGDISENTITLEQKEVMKFHYLVMSRYNENYDINDVLNWLKDKPSQNTRNGRKYAIAQFVERFC